MCILERYEQSHLILVWLKVIFKHKILQRIKVRKMKVRKLNHKWDIYVINPLRLKDHLLREGRKIKSQKSEELERNKTGLLYS